ncbi:hypothetical protein OGAPHI_002719 [Ogataea philodendri]|uniref:Band 7 domain-containing protein n=1 Tax=Ogataea philodendri TaxID=1378263 RepID=A0A9P8PCI5_9ASCO|nr:uncharacterized protein OGAPHI_002719 [Ogataea philodendri]KAH3668964.1 hypothetical protein OGAPHI_002719 [Ogataea philodendri]
MTTPYENNNLNNIPTDDSFQADQDFVKPKSSGRTGPVITKQPRAREDFQASYAFEWDTPTNGWYGSLVDTVGSCFGTLGAIPCCFCFPNPYRNVDQGNVGLITKFGQLYKSVDPGLTKVNPLSEKLHHANITLKTMQIPTLTCYTKDNVSITLSSVLYYQVIEPHKAFFTVYDIEDSLRERTQTTLRQVLGARNLQDAIERREEIAQSIEEIIAEPAANWGVKVESLLIKDFSLPPGVSNSLSMAAEAKRIGESKIIQARAEVESAKLMRKAADVLASKAAMQIRYLDAMQKMAENSNAKVIFMPSQNAIERTAQASSGGGDAPATDTYPDDADNLPRVLSLQEAL